MILGLGVIISACVWMEMREDEDEEGVLDIILYGSDIKINKKENNYLCNDQIPNLMVLSYIHTH